LHLVSLSKVLLLRGMRQSMQRINYLELLRKTTLNRKRMPMPRKTHADEKGAIGCAG